MQTAPWYLLDLIIGFDEEQEENEEESEEENEEDEKDKEEEEDDEEEEDSSDKPTEAEKKLREALRKERKDRREAQKETRRLTRESKAKAGKEKTAEEREAAAVATSERLATKLRDTAVDNAITKMASSKEFKFRDIDDALRLIDRKEIEVDQDDDDPADIEVDEETVEAALKQLADKKPHLLLAEGDGEESGGRFNGKKKTKEGASDDALRERYSALQRGAPPVRST